MLNESTHLLVVNKLLDVYEIHNILTIPSSENRYNISFYCGNNMYKVFEQILVTDSLDNKIVYIVDLNLNIIPLVLSGMKYNVDSNIIECSFELFNTLVIDKQQLFNTILKSNVDKKWKQLIIEVV